MQRHRRVRRRSIGAVLGAVLGVFVYLDALVVIGAIGIAHAASGDVVLLGDVGEGFVADPPEATGFGGQQRTYRHPLGELTMQGSVLPKGMSPVTLIDAYVASVGTDFPEVAVPSIPGAAAFHLGEPGGFQATSMIFPSTEAIFIATLQTDVGATWDPVDFLTRLATRQIAASGGPITPMPAPEVPAELVAYLPTAESMTGSFTLLSQFGGNEDLSDDIGANPRLIDFLSRNTVSAVQLWATTDGEVLVGVDATRYPYERFAGAALGSMPLGEMRRTTLDGVTGVIAGAIAWEGTGSREGEFGAIFRRGRFTFSTIADRQDPATRAAVAGIISNVARIAPEGDSSARPLPSSRTSIALSAALVIAFGLALIAFRMLLSRRLASTSPIVSPGHFTVTDTTGGARKLRRSAVGLTAVQLCTWALAIVGFAADAPTGVRVGIVGFAVVAGFVTTGWWRRRELSHIGALPPRWRPSVPEFRGIALSLLGIAAFLLGMAAVVWGLRELVFVPSLTHLQWCDRLKISPTALALLIMVAGLLLVVVATTILRLARAHGRFNADRTRRLDPRPPVLYLRSFEDDDVALPCVLSARRPFLELFTLRATDPFEESLAWELATYGPVTAVGRPGGAARQLGAAREYFTNETWKPHVVERMQGAGVIAVVIGDTPGLEWEIDTIASEGHLGKTVFLLPPGTADDHRRRWETSRAGLPENLRCNLDLTSVLSFQFCDDELAVTVGDRRDEAAYRVAVDLSLARSFSGARFVSDAE